MSDAIQPAWMFHAMRVSMPGCPVWSLIVSYENERQDVNTRVYYCDN